MRPDSEAFRILFIVPVALIPCLQIAGLVVCSRGGVRAPWWVMFVGMVLTLVTNLIYLYQAFRPGLLGSGRSALDSYYRVAIASSFGGLLFAIGFAWRGLRISAAAGRIAELEGMRATLAAEVSRESSRRL